MRHFPEMNSRLNSRRIIGWRMVRCALCGPLGSYDDAKKCFAAGAHDRNQRLRALQHAMDLRHRSAGNLQKSPVLLHHEQWCNPEGRERCFRSRTAEQGTNTRLCVPQSHQWRELALGRQQENAQAVCSCPRELIVAAGRRRPAVPTRWSS